ncbi:hypothetical protein [Nocardia sp. NPDC059239]|uniref:hypothetical protein n=1 Tax=unclassified Nocardia TaxID=2637762 RepID=UPI0036A196C9
MQSGQDHGNPGITMAVGGTMAVRASPWRCGAWRSRADGRIAPEEVGSRGWGSETARPPDSGLSGG